MKVLSERVAIRQGKIPMLLIHYKKISDRNSTNLSDKNNKILTTY